jgi:hypothetical protein
MKIVLLSFSIGVLGYFALQTLSDPKKAPRFAATSQEVAADTDTESRAAPRVRGHR